MKNFAIIGAAGFVAPRHMKAIYETGNRLVAAADPHDSMGVLDRWFADVKYFPEIERFDRHMEKLRNGPPENRVHFISICSPNYLHDAHARLALRSGADAICEKPLVINPWNLDQLARVEEETGQRVYAVLQLRLHPDIIALRRAMRKDGPRHRVELDYITGRGPWYHASWKGREERSGGLPANIGIHFFDMLLWLFGPADSVTVRESSPSLWSGELTLARADVSWRLSVDIDALPVPVRAAGRTTHRAIRIDDQLVNFTEGFADLHTRAYEEVLAGRGFGIADARPAIELVRRIRDGRRK
jgi:UDP-N-acetyl-2-amino-2-deoxyglucuronate dehydrogenase